MASNSLMKKINLRLVLLHVCAAVFFMLAASIFSYFYDIPFMNDYLGRNNMTSKDLIEKHWRNFPFLITWTGIIPIGGLLIAFLISLLISIRRQSHWLNSLLVLVLGYGIYYFGLKSIYPLRPFLTMPYYVFDNWIWAFVLNGLLMLIIGCFIFFYSKFNKIVFRQESI